MSPWRAEFGRSVRERRGGLIAGAALLAAAEALAFVAAGDRLTVRWTETFPAIAVGLAGLAVAGDLFGRDLRSGAHALVLRTPGALRGALVGRLALLTAAIGAAAALELGTRAVLSVVVAPPRDFDWVVEKVEANETFWKQSPIAPDHLLGLPFAPTLAALVAAAVVWVALGSSWTRWRPPAALGGLAALLASAATLAAVVGEASGFFPVMPVDAAILVGGGAVVAVSALAWGWTRGRRRLVAGVGCAARGLAVVALATVASDVALGATLSRWLDPAPDAEDLRIDDAVLGASGHHLALTVVRGNSASSPAGAADAPNRWTRPMAWVVDLDTGRRTRLGVQRHLAVFDRPRVADMRVRPFGLSQVPLAPQPWIVVVHQGVRAEEVWIDGTTGGIRLVRRPVGARLVPDVPIEWRRAVARANSPVRDSQGRRAWLMGRRVEHEGEGFPIVDDREWENDSPYFGLRPVPGGWFGWSREPLPGSTFAFGRHLFVDADAGDVTTSPSAGGAGAGQVAVARDAVLHAIWVRGARPPAQRFVLTRLDGTEARDVGDDLTAGLRGTPVPVADGVVLVSIPDTEGGPRRPTLWRPATDERIPLRVEGNVGDVDTLFATGMGRTPEGRTLVVAARWRPPISERCLLLVDPATATGRALTPWEQGAARTEPFCVETDGSVLAIEHERRIVRLGPAPGARAVVFPRAAPTGERDD